MKHAGATRIDITATVNGQTIDVTINDNGKGIDPKNMRSGGSGLRNMKQRIESIGGTFRIDNAQGTAIYLSAPISQEQLVP